MDTDNYTLTYYQNLKSQFLKYLDIIRKLDEDYNTRYKVLNFDDEVLGYADEQFTLLAGELCMHNVDEDGVFATISNYFDDKKVANWHNDEYCLIKDDEEFFDYCYADYLETNLQRAIDDRLAFWSETYYTLICSPNDWMYKFYTNAELEQIANNLTKYIQEKKESCSILFNGEEFLIEDSNYICIQEGEMLEQRQCYLYNSDFDECPIKD